MLIRSKWKQAEHFPSQTMPCDMITTYKKAAKGDGALGIPILNYQNALILLFDLQWCFFLHRYKKNIPILKNFLQYKRHIYMYKQIIIDKN